MTFKFYVCRSPEEDDAPASHYVIRNPGNFHFERGHKFSNGDIAVARTNNESIAYMIVSQFDFMGNFIKNAEGAK